MEEPAPSVGTTMEYPCRSGSQLSPSSPAIWAGGLPSPIPFPVWHWLHFLCLAHSFLAPDAPHPLAGAQGGAWSHATGSSDAVPVSMGSSGCSSRCSCCCKISENPLLCLSLCNATSSCPCSSISSTHEDFILHQVSLHSHLPCVGTSVHTSSPLPRECLACFGAGGAALGKDSRAGPRSVPCRSRGTRLGRREESVGH